MEMFTFFKLKNIKHAQKVSQITIYFTVNIIMMSGGKIRTQS